MSELAIYFPLDPNLLSPEVFESRRRPGQPSRENQSRGSNSTGNPFDPRNPRNILLLATTGVLVSAALLFGGVGQKIIDHIQPKPSPTVPAKSQAELGIIPTSSPYDWDQFQNRALPKEVIAAIGQDLISQTRYPGFPEIGKLIVLTQADPSTLTNYFPQYPSAEPINIKLEDLFKTEGSIGHLYFGTSHTDVKAIITNRQTGLSQQTVIEKISSEEVVVTLDNSFTKAPDAAKKLIIAKEFWQFLKLKESQQRISKAVDDKFNIKPSEEMDLLFALQTAAIRNTRISGLNGIDAYDQAHSDLDCAGHYHTVQTFGLMKSQGLFSDSDLKVLTINDNIFKAATKEGLLSEKNGTFSWREGITTFSQDWLNLCRPLWTGATPQSTR